MNAEVKQIVSADDLELLTGAKQSEDQAEVLGRAGIHFWLDDGAIVTTWDHVNHPLPPLKKSNESNFCDDMFQWENSCHGGISLIPYLEENMERFCREDYRGNISSYHFIKNQGPNEPGCYFLWLEEELRYVGKAQAISKRLRCHWQKEDLDFDSFSYILTPCNHVAEYVEGFFIKALKPPENSYRPKVCEITDKLLKELGYEC